MLSSVRFARPLADLPGTPCAPRTAGTASWPGPAVAVLPRHPGLADAGGRRRARHRERHRQARGQHPPGRSAEVAVVGRPAGKCPEPLIGPLHRSRPCRFVAAGTARASLRRAASRWSTATNPAHRRIGPSACIHHTSPPTTLAATPVLAAVVIKAVTSSSGRFSVFLCGKRLRS